MRTEHLHIPTRAGQMKLIVLRPSNVPGPLPAILWIHGGGYATGMAAMVYASCGKMLGKRYGAVVLSPGYRLSWQAPYPAALEDCYDALCYLWHHAEELGVDRSRITVGGESAGGGLAAAVCLYARDQGEVHVAFQLPLYPMLDCLDTPSSRDNHGHVWNTRRNHRAWKLYLGPLAGTDRIPSYASPSRETDYSRLPPAYTYVCEGEPFRDETLTYVQALRKAGTAAEADLYPGCTHGFDLLMPWKKASREARRKLCRAYAARFSLPEP